MHQHRTIRCVCVFALLLFAALAAFGDSLDTWTRRNSGTVTNLNGVAYGHGQYVCVGQLGHILTSADGTNWTARISGVSTTLMGVAFGLDRFVVVGQGGVILTSTNGHDWQVQTSPTTNQLNRVALCGHQFVTGGALGTILTSTDGEHWTKQVTPTSRTLKGFSFGNEVSVAVGQGNSNPMLILSSTNGVDWTDRSSYGVAGYAVAFGGGTFVAMDARGAPYVSSNGVSWKSVWPPAAGADYLFGITYAQRVFVAVGGPYSASAQRISTSHSGFTWKQKVVSTGQSGALRDVAYGNGYFIAVGDNGLIVQSGPIFSLNWAPGNTLVLDGEAGRAYRIQSLSDLGTTNWTDILNHTNSAEVTPVLEIGSDNSGAVFYRAVIP